MKFCDICGTHMEKIPQIIGGVLFECTCGRQIWGRPDDTLMSSGQIDADNSALRDAVFIQNSPHDPAANTVMRKCTKCNAPYMTLIQVGLDLTTMYTCKCGFSIIHKKYEEQYGAA